MLRVQRTAVYPECHLDMYKIKRLGCSSLRSLVLIRDNYMLILIFSNDGEDHKRLNIMPQNRRSSNILDRFIMHG